MADISSLFTWESLESHISGYSGPIKIRRLQQIAEEFESIRQPVLLLLLKTIEEESLDTRTYSKVTQQLQSLDPAFQPNTAWIKAATNQADGLTDKLEQELKAYKNNLIKESIRMGQQDIANHYIKTGQLDKALKALFRNRDYCTTAQHSLEVNLQITELLVLTQDYEQTLTYVARAQTHLAQIYNTDKVLAENQLRAAAGMALLADGKYEKAAEKFQSIEAVIGTSYNTILTMNDIANYTCLLALATFSRDKILKLSESSTFKPFLELELNAREALTAFHKSQYAECFRLLENIKGNMQADYFLWAHVSDIYERIMDRSMLQFAAAFNRVKLERIAATFAKPIEQVEERLAKLIADKKLPHMRLDLVNLELIDQGTILRNDVLDKTSEMSDKYKDEVERALFYLAIKKARLTVIAPKIGDGRKAAVFDGRSALQYLPEPSDMMEVDGMA